jgi:ribosomal protein S18 acetylase RimI-like enzyme
LLTGYPAEMLTSYKELRTMITIRRATADDAEWMQTGFDTRMGWTKPAGYFAGLCQKQTAGELVLLVAAVDGDYAGHLKIIWGPNYPYFKDNGIPEIQDLNVLRHYRRQGIATRMMDEAERIIKTRSDVAGIGFGLYADYGAAQRMYVLRGYVPDGMGVSWRDAYAAPGSTVVVDDELVLGLVKAL